MKERQAKSAGYRGEFEGSAGTAQVEELYHH